MTLKYLLATDTVSFALRGVEEVVTRLRERRPSEIAISSLTVAELRFGADRRKSARLHQLIDAFCSGVTVLPFDEDAAAAFGKVGAALYARGEPIGQIDTLIAAHALSENLTLVTGNVKHYGRVSGLRCEDWKREE